MSCLALAGVSPISQAAGLGKIVVFSALGQPLRAEIEVTATREELSDMRAQLAPMEAFKQAGLDYPATLQGLRFTLDKRANGQAVIKLTSHAPINDPFIDVLLELNWPSGRLVREYTFLLDPPELAAKSAAMVVPASAPVAAPAPAPRPAAPVSAQAEKAPVVRARTKEEAPRAAEPSGAGQESVEVKRGDTLHRIAVAARPEGVSMEQMLVGLFRANQEAFDGRNMNRLKAGKILTIPEKAALEEVSPGEARKIVLTQSSDWNAYRSKVAALAAQTPAGDTGAGRQEASGRITAKVEEKKAAVVETKDQLKVSRTDVTAPGAATVARRAEEDLAAKDKALKEANDRLALLEKNVANLQKLLELKNQSLAELQKQSSDKSATAAPVAAVKPAPVVQPAPATPLPPETAPVQKPNESKPAEPAPKPEDLKEPKPVAAPAAEAPKPAPKPVAPPPPPAPEASFVDSLLEDPLILGGGAGVVALLGALAFLRRRGRKEEQPVAFESSETPPDINLASNAVFRSTGGQSVDTTHSPVIPTDFSQAGPGSIDTDDVDPVAEADVYMAYGRDVQAEEILLEALLKDQKRYAIHLKLLEIYAGRRDTSRFESIARQLYDETGGAGTDWEKAAALGARVDPGNPLYGTVVRSTAEAYAPTTYDPDATVVIEPKHEMPPPVYDPDATVVVEPQSETAPTTVAGILAQLADQAGKSDEVQQVVDPAPAATNDLASLDFDLGERAPAAEPAKPAAFSPEAFSAVSEPAATNDIAPLDFDLSGTAPAPAPTKAETFAAELDTLDFDLAQLPELPARTESFAAPAAENAAAQMADLDFDLDVGSEPAVSATPETQDKAPDLDFDLGFDVPPAFSAPTPVPAAVVGEEPLPVPEDDMSGVEFDVNLTESSFLGQSMPMASSFDMSSIDLDLKPSADDLSAAMPEAAFAPPASGLPADDLSLPDVDFGTPAKPDGLGEEPAGLDAFAAAAATSSFGAGLDPLPDFDISANEEVATKLDLAKAYEEMGDNEGARELLQEVLAEGDPAQKEKAQAILNRLGA